MRFKTSLRNIKTFTKFTASLASIGKIAWVRLDDNNVRFTIIPEQGSQVWASLTIDSLFYDYNIQSRTESNTINLELPLAPLQAALKSAVNATSASLRLTKRDGDAILSLTIVTLPIQNPNTIRARDPFGDGFDEEGLLDGDDEDGGGRIGGRGETIITQDIPIRILSAITVEGIHEPRVREPDVHILLPPLLSLKAVSDRFTKLALVSTTGTRPSASTIPKLVLSANMHGSLKLSLSTDQLQISSLWSNLANPDLDPEQVDTSTGTQIPSEVMREKGPDAWASVRIDGKDWGRVLSVGRLGGRVIACFVDGHALILYVYLGQEDDEEGESVITYYVTSFVE